MEIWVKDRVGSSRFLLTNEDDFFQWKQVFYSLCIWLDSNDRVYFLTSKYKVFSVFKVFEAIVESESVCNLKYIISHNRTEYTSYQFSKYSKFFGIQHQFTFATLHCLFAKWITTSSSPRKYTIWRMEGYQVLYNTLECNWFGMIFTCSLF